MLELFIEEGRAGLCLWSDTQVGPHIHNFLWNFLPINVISKCWDTVEQLILLDCSAPHFRQWCCEGCINRAQIESFLIIGLFSTPRSNLFSRDRPGAATGRVGVKDDSPTFRQYPVAPLPSWVPRLCLWIQQPPSLCHMTGKDFKTRLVSQLLVPAFCVCRILSYTPSELSSRALLVWIT